MTHFLSKAVVVNATDEVSHEPFSDFDIDAGENELIEVKHAGAASIMVSLYNSSYNQDPIILPEMSFTEILENDVTARQATLQIALVFE